MKDIKIDCTPSLTEDHLKQIESAISQAKPGQKVEVALSRDDNFKIHDILDSMEAANMETRSDFNSDIAVVKGHKLR